MLWFAGRSGGCVPVFSDYLRAVGQVIRAHRFNAKNTVTVARSLLGKVLVRETSTGLSRHILTEVEAYHSERDLACHASKGRTLRTEVLYREAGIWYVYLCYGIHEMVNLVVGPADFPAAILIRGVHDAIGPGRVAKALKINRSLNGQLAEPASGLWIEDQGLRVPRSWILAGPRVGVNFAGEIWSAKPWRFRISANRIPQLVTQFAQSVGVGEPHLQSRPLI